MILTPDRYRRMPWANGKGVTIEMLRIEGPEGLVLRLSRATVAEDGEFSLFPGIERNLTVLTGPGFDLVGPAAGPAKRLAARPLVPVAFPGDLPIRAERVTAPSDDFNVMTARSLPRPEVRLLRTGESLGGETLVLYALGEARLGDAPLGDRALPDRSLMISRGHVQVTGGQVLAVALQGLQADQLRGIG